MSAPTTRAAPQRLRRWLAEPINLGVVRAAGTVAFFAVAGNVAGLVRDAVVARRFGLGDELDAYLTALLLPTLAISVISGSLTVALLPVYVGVRERDGREAAHHLVARSMGWAVLALAAVALLFALLAPMFLPWLAPGFPAAKLALVRRLLYLLLPSLFFSGMAAVWTAVLNAGERFALAAAAPSSIPVATIALVLLFPTLGAYAMAAGTTLGYALAAVMIGLTLRSAGMSPMPQLRGMTPAVRSVLQEYWPMLIGSLFMAGTNLVDQAMAASLGTGSVAALGLGGKLTAAASGVATVALGAAIFPPLSRWVAMEDWRALRRAFRQYSLLMLVAGLAGTLLLVVGAGPLVALLFGGRAFDAEAVARVTTVQRLIAWQLPFAVTGLIGARILSALGRNRILMVVGALNVVTNAVGNLVLMRYLGLAGIALATSVTYLISCTILLLAARRELARRELGTVDPAHRAVPATP
jgi:putative peptidoglycan lipid II flippase